MFTDSGSFYLPAAAFAFFCFSSSWINSYGGDGRWLLGWNMCEKVRTGLCYGMCGGGWRWLLAVAGHFLGKYVGGEYEPNLIRDTIAQSYDDICEDNNWYARVCGVGGGQS